MQKLEMFNKDVLEERLGPLKKSTKLKSLEAIEKYTLKKCKENGLEHSYDVIAQEMPYFKTMGYTEYATNFIMQPLNSDLRSQQNRDAFLDDCEVLDFCQYFRKNIKEKEANKYQDREADFKRYPARDFLVVLPGSNKIKEKTCLNKLKKIAKTHKGKVWFKPHPITVHAIIGELKDILGPENILPRDIDLYYYLPKAKKVYTTHISESATYAVALGIPIEPIDVYIGMETGSFYNINRFLFEFQKDGIAYINKVYSSPKSGIINPVIDKDWKQKIDKYFKYIIARRNVFKDWYLIKEKNAK